MYTSYMYVRNDFTYRKEKNDIDANEAHVIKYRPLDTISIFGYDSERSQWVNIWNLRNDAN